MDEAATVASVAHWDAREEVGAESGEVHGGCRAQRADAEVSESGCREGERVEGQRKTRCQGQEGMLCGAHRIFGATPNRAVTASVASVAEWDAREEVGAESGEVHGG